MRLVCAILLTLSSAAAQTFDVASVKPAAPYKGGPIHIAVTGGPGTADPTRLTFSNSTLTAVLRMAFNLQGKQKINGPEWLNIDMFDIAATLPPGATKDQMRAMLRNLLAERFHMTSHREKQDLPSYALIAPKGRAGLHAAKNAASDPAQKDKSLPGIRTLTCDNCTIGQFVSMLGHPDGRPVTDRTGLTGTYDFALTFEPEYLCTNCVVAVVGGGDETSPRPEPPPPNEAPPILSVALGQQLGLKLEKTQTPTDVIVIDHIDRVPVPN